MNEATTTLTRAEALEVHLMLVERDVLIEGQSVKIHCHCLTVDGNGRVPASSAPAGMSEAQRLDGIVANSQRDRRRQDLRDKWMPEAEVALTGHRAACEQRQKELAASQYAYKQNLYGKTHAAQMASEMAAAAATCDIKDRELKDKLDTFDKECATLKCR